MPEPGEDHYLRSDPPRFGSVMPVSMGPQGSLNGFMSDDDEVIALFSQLMAIRPAERALAWTATRMVLRIGDVAERDFLVLAFRTTPMGTGIERERMIFVPHVEDAISQMRAIADSIEAADAELVLDEDRLSVRLRQDGKDDVEEESDP